MSYSNNHPPQSFQASDRYLCIGHCCHDLLDNKNILGGCTSYSSLVARQLGLEVAVLTSVGDNFEFLDTFTSKGIHFFNKKSLKTTVFENIYQGNLRTQYIHARAETLFAEDVPQDWRNATIVQLGLIADEVDFSIFKVFPNVLIGATIQGWLRKWDHTGKVSPKAMDWSKLAAADVVIMSDADIEGFENAIPTIASYVDVLVITQGANGAAVYNKSIEHHFPSYPVNEVDSTGAGDVFTAAFLVKYAQTRDIALATGYAHAAASFIVEGIGINNLPSLHQIEERFTQYQSLILNKMDKDKSLEKIAPPQYKDQ